MNYMGKTSKKRECTFTRNRTANTSQNIIIFTSFVRLFCVTKSWIVAAKICFSFSLLDNSGLLAALFHVVPPDTRLIEQSLSDSLALYHDIASQVVLVVKNPPTNAEDVRNADLIPGSGRSPGGGHGNSLQYYFLWSVFDYFIILIGV